MVVVVVVGVLGVVGCKVHIWEGVFSAVSVEGRVGLEVGDRRQELVALATRGSTGCRRHVGP